MVSPLNPTGTLCVLCCRAYVRHLGLSVNQPLHILGCGDFNIDRIEVAHEPVSSGCKPAANGVQGMDMAGSGAGVLAVADPAARQGVVRLNTPDPLAGEQTWPTTEVCICSIRCAAGLYPLTRLLHTVLYGKCVLLISAQTKCSCSHHCGFFYTTLSGQTFGTL